MRLLPYAGDWLHRPSQFAERNNRLVSRISSDQVRPQEATKPHLCHIHACASLQQKPGGLRRWKLLGYARHRHPAE